MVVDGKAGVRYDTILFPFYSPDSRHLAYGAQKGGKWLIVKDGAEGALYDKI